MKIRIYEKNDSLGSLAVEVAFDDQTWETLVYGEYDLESMAEAIKEQIVEDYEEYGEDHVVEGFNDSNRWEEMDEDD